MTTASKRSLHPDVIKRIGRLEIRARHIVEGLLSGMHRSPYFGQSVEFLQHREYVPGDDLRRVDWKVWAKQDRLYVKQYEEDTNLRCCLIVDTSGSMGFGSKGITKLEYARKLAGTLAFGASACGGGGEPESHRGLSRRRCRGPPGGRRLWPLTRY